MVIEAEVEGHLIHRMYVDEGKGIILTFRLGHPESQDRPSPMVVDLKTVTLIEVPIVVVCHLCRLFTGRILMDKKQCYQIVYFQLYYHYIPFRGKKSSSRSSVDTSKATYFQCRLSLPHSSLSTSGLTISASTHLRNHYISKKILSQCRYQVYTLSSSILPLLTSTPTILGLDTSS
ncbi:hypothetical protein Tco_1109358 [Tanacetum coccineum]